jgi:dTDP-glucose 4,6-dehydratase
MVASKADVLADRHAVVLGGAGFLGSHLCDALVAAGARVTCIDNFITGSPDNVGHLMGSGGFRLVEYDVTDFLHLPDHVDYIFHLASPASPADYRRWPIQTLKVGSLGTHKAMGLANAKGARTVLASTSEVYGDPEVSPQPETYWGNVNPVGPRGVYDESKRFAEAMALAYHNEHGVSVALARIFNTYGSRMRLDDGRAVPAFFSTALRGEPLPIFGDGKQTRSLCFVDDLIAGLVALAVSEHIGPMNLGNPEEITILELAETIQEVVGSSAGFEFHDRPVDDPMVRRPDTALAEKVLGWEAKVSLHDGLTRTLPWFESQVPRA